MKTQRGFTLIEIMVVVTIIAIGSAGVALALRDSAADAAQREGERLAAILEAARAQSRASGIPVVFRPVEARELAAAGLGSAPGFVVFAVGQTDPRAVRPQSWAEADTQLVSAEQGKAPGQRFERSGAMLVGPEPILAPSRIVLQHGAAQVEVATDGVRPFEARLIESPSTRP
jgi:general secretion pathway protein H